MISQRKSALVLLLGLVVASAITVPATSIADTDDPPSRVARLAYLEGAISFQPGGTDEWVAAPLNRPITTGDKIWSDRGSRAELELDGSALRLSSNTSVSFLNLGDNVSQIQLSVGTLLVRVRRLDDNETSGTGAAYSVYANEYDVFSGTDELVENAQPYGPEPDSFDAWSQGRDSRWDNSDSARYVSSDVVGYEDLDGQGAWESTPDYGNVWFPRSVEPGWAPYHDGHWSYIEPWGYTWVDDQRWGFAPFHYGRWISVRGAWGWVPCPPRAYGAVYVRPVYAPALVAWVGVGTGVAWFALGPREVYVPSYPVSRRYVNNINVSNTTVNTTVINNVYNTTIINNKTINVTNVNYVNRNVPGAVVATTSQAFTTAQPIARNAVHVDERAIVSAPVRVVTPAVVPTKQSVLGGGRSVAARPSAIVQTRTVVARVAPPAPPPAFERRQEAITANGAPPAMPAVVHPPAPPVVSPSAGAGREPVRPPSAASAGNRPASVAVHPQELPQVLRPASPSTANTALERQHLQEQQTLIAQQAAERQRVQQQQERDHAQLAKQQADDARKQQLEQQQRQQQAQQLAQQRAQELQQQAEQARRQQLEQQQRQQQAQQLEQQQRQQQAQQLEQQQRQQQAQQMEQQQRQQQAQQLAQQHAQELQQQQARQQADEARRQQLEQQHQQQTQQLAQQHAQALQQQQEQQQEQRRQLEAQAQSRNQKAARPPNQKP